MNHKEHKKKLYPLTPLYLFQKLLRMCVKFLGVGTYNLPKSRSKVASFFSKIWLPNFFFVYNINIFKNFNIFQWDFPVLEEKRNSTPKNVGRIMKNIAELCKKNV